MKATKKNMASLAFKGVRLCCYHSDFPLSGLQVINIYNILLSEEAV